ncbi:MAG: hypothetical protein U0575_02695 [Phycisphaerales bacterium]
MTYRFVRWFHRPARRTPGPGLGIADKHARTDWNGSMSGARRVDTALFRPMPPAVTDLRGRSSCASAAWRLEKNIEAFLDAQAARQQDRRRRQAGAAAWSVTIRRALVDARSAWTSSPTIATPASSAYSRTDTFGIVMLKSRYGLPVAAYPVTGPIDVVRWPDGLARRRRPSPPAGRSSFRGRVHRARAGNRGGDAGGDARRDATRAR